ncbi:hypothetical protein AAE478_006420 [Parahypoxylon ruwenzoriense]
MNPQRRASSPLSGSGESYFSLPSRGGSGGGYENSRGQGRNCPMPEDSSASGTRPNRYRGFNGARTTANSGLSGNSGLPVLRDGISRNLGVSRGRDTLAREDGGEVPRRGLSSVITATTTEDGRHWTIPCGPDNGGRVPEPRGEGYVLARGTVHTGAPFVLRITPDGRRYSWTVGEAPVVSSCSSSEVDVAERSQSSQNSVMNGSEGEMVEREEIERDEEEEWVKDEEWVDEEEVPYMPLDAEVRPAAITRRRSSHRRDEIYRDEDLQISSEDIEAAMVLVELSRSGRR